MEPQQRASLVVFAGAGLSSLGPTSLPSWFHFNRAVLDATARAAGRVVDPGLARDAATGVLALQQSIDIPPELQSEILAKRLGPDLYFDAVAQLDSARPNDAHYALARLAAEGTVASIVTTNFDRCIEIAFHDLGVPVAVQYRDGDFNAGSATVTRRGTPLLKIHGSVEDPHSLVDSLTQRCLGLSDAKSGTLKALLRAHRWLFVGYSGWDLTVGRDYLGLLGTADVAVGFDWLVRDDSKPPEHLESLLDIYGNKARLISGSLPGYLTQLCAIPPPPTPAARPPSIEEIDPKIADWGDKLEPGRAVLALSDLLFAVGQEGRAEQLLTYASEVRSQGVFRRWIKRRTTVQDPRQIEASAAASLSLANFFLRSGRLAEAGRMYTRARRQYVAAAAEHKVPLVDRAEAELWIARGELQKAVAFYMRQGPETLLELASLLSNSAGVRLRLLDYDGALVASEQSAKLAEQTGAERLRIGALTNMGAALRGLHRWADAAERYTDALGSAARLKDRRLESALHLNLFNVWADRAENGDHPEFFDQALDHYHRARQLKEELNDPGGLGRTMANLAARLCRRQSFADGLALYQEALPLRERAGDVLGMGHTALGIGGALLALGRPSEATVFARRAKHSFAKAGVPNERQADELIVAINQITRFDC